MMQPYDFEHLAAIRGSRLSYRAWFYGNTRDRAIIEMAFSMLCDSIVNSPQLQNGVHPHLSDVLRCVVTAQQELSTLVTGDQSPKPMRTIDPKITIQSRTTPTHFQLVLQTGSAEVVVREVKR